MYPRIVIAGTHSGVGKTTVSLGLMGVLSGQEIPIGIITGVLGGDFFITMTWRRGPF